MKKQGMMQLLFFCLIPIGAILLFFSIRFLKKGLYGDLIAEMPYTQNSVLFELKTPGTYSIWHHGQFFRRAPLDEFRPEIINEETGSRIKLSSFLFRPNRNNGIDASMELFRFNAPAGRFRMDLVPGSSISSLEDRLLRLIPARTVDYDKYYIQVRETRPLLLVFAGIVIVVFSGFCIIGGLVFGILARQIFK